MSLQRFLCRFGRELDRFRANENGNFTIVAAAIMVPLLLMVGVAVDYSNASKVRSKLQNAVDAATLAATRAVGEGITKKSELQKIANASLQSHFPNAAALGGISATLTYNPDTKLIDISAIAPVGTSFMRLVNIEKLDVGADAQSVAAGIEAEITMVLDATGSMSGSKIINLRTAATSLVDALLPKKVNAKDAMLRVAMVPYAASVNIGTLGKANTIAPGKKSWATFFMVIVQILKGEGSSQEKWAKVKAYIDAVKQGKAFTQNYPCVTERVGKKALSDDGDLKANPILDMTTNCPSAEVVPLTTDASKLKSEITNLNAGGMTAGHIGLGWGWYTLSPDMAKNVWPENKTPAKYKDDVVKILVLMTDGAFNTNYVGESSSAQTLKLCKAIKDEGVLIYTVGFQAPPSALTMLKGCASNVSMFFDAQSGAELEKTFKKIAAETKALRLSM